MNINRHIISDALLRDMEIICVLDGYEPQLAHIVTEAISEQSELTITIMWNYAADRARETANWN